MKVGIVSVQKKERKGSGFDDILKELKKRETEYKIFDPKELFWAEGEFYLFHGGNVLNLREETKDIDIFYLRSILGKGSSPNRESFKMILRLNALESLQKPIVNEPEAIYKSKDKSWACINLYHLGVIPRTAVFSLESVKKKEQLMHAVRHALIGRRKVVIKPNDRTGGEGCVYIEPQIKYVPFVEAYRFKDLLMQDKIEGPEYRFWYVGNQFKGAIQRVSAENDFRGNTSRGGTEAPYEPSEKEKELGLKVVMGHGLEVTALDLKRDERDNSLKLLEANCYPGWKTLKRVYGRSLAPDVISYLEYKVKNSIAKT